MYDFASKRKKIQFIVEKMKLFKMHQIIKPTCPSRQLFETVNFAFMKIFDFLVKIVIFGAFFLFLGDLRHTANLCSETAV